jgi:hypothetical protein
MALIQIARRTGEVKRVPPREAPVVELDLDDNQTIVGWECHPVTMFHSDRKTVDWYWSAWVATRL